DDRKGNAGRDGPALPGTLRHRHRCGLDGFGHRSRGRGEANLGELPFRRKTDELPLLLGGGEGSATRFARLEVVLHGPVVGLVEDAVQVIEELGLAVVANTHDISPLAGRVPYAKPQAAGRRRV